MAKKKVTKQKAQELPKVEHKVTFSAWFEKAKKKHKLRDHQDYALQVFFEKQGLTDFEDPIKYDEAAKRF